MNSVLTKDYITYTVWVVTCGISGRTRAPFLQGIEVPNDKTLFRYSMVLKFGTSALVASQVAYQTVNTEAKVLAQIPVIWMSAAPSGFIAVTR